MPPLTPGARYAQQKVSVETRDFGQIHYQSGRESKVEKTRENRLGAEEGDSEDPKIVDEAGREDAEEIAESHEERAESRR